MIKQSFTLSGQLVDLVPLSLSHHARLCEIGLDETLWRSTTIQLQTPGDMLVYIQTALAQQKNGTSIPFAIVDKASDQIVGTTRFHNINAEHRRLEIGFTWIAPPWQRTGLNIEAKYLLLRTAFEELDCVRVEFKTDCSNQQSQRALLNIGAKQEGLLRSYLISKHKGPRDVAVFSIIDKEWPEVKKHMERKLGILK